MAHLIGWMFLIDFKCFLGQIGFRVILVPVECFISDVVHCFLFEGDTALDEFFF